MPFYLMLSKLTDRGRDRIQNTPERILEVNQEAEERRCRIVSQYFLMGPYDFATTLEAPDNETVQRLAIGLGARGTIDTLTMPATKLDDLVSDLKAHAGA